MLLFYLINYGGLHDYNTYVKCKQLCTLLCSTLYKLAPITENVLLLVDVNDVGNEMQCNGQHIFSLSSVVKQWISISLVIIQQGLCQMIK